MEVDQWISKLETFRRLAQEVPPPVGPEIDFGLEVVELMVSFIAPEDFDKAKEQLRALIRSGMTSSVVAELAQKFPNG